MTRDSNVWSYPPGENKAANEDKPPTEAELSLSNTPPEDGRYRMAEDGRYYNPPPQGGMPPAAPSSDPAKGAAIASLVLGILGVLDPFIIFGVIMGIIGIVLACKARKHESPSRGTATAGLVLSIISVVLNALIILFFLLVIFISIPLFEEFYYYAWPYLY